MESSRDIKPWCVTSQVHFDILYRLGRISQHDMPSVFFAVRRNISYILAWHALFSKRISTLQPQTTSALQQKFSDIPHKNSNKCKEAVSLWPSPVYWMYHRSFRTCALPKSSAVWIKFAFAANAYRSASLYWRILHFLHFPDAKFCHIFYYTIIEAKRTVLTFLGFVCKPWPKRQKISI